jgi:hypothetical protein
MSCEIRVRLAWAKWSGNEWSRSRFEGSQKGRADECFDPSISVPVRVLTRAFKIVCLSKCYGLESMLFPPQKGPDLPVLLSIDAHPRGNDRDNLKYFIDEFGYNSTVIFRQLAQVNRYIEILIDRRSRCSQKSE